MSINRRYDTLLPKLMSRVTAEAARQGRAVDADFIDAAQRLLSQRLHERTLSDKDIRHIVQLSQPRSASAVDPAMSRKDVVTVTAAQQRPVAETPQPEVHHGSVASSTASGLIFNTTRRQRQLLADQQWIAQAEQDRQEAALKRLEEKQTKIQAQAQQRGALDGQMSAWDRQKMMERQAKQKAQEDMTRAIEEAREAARQERESALLKAKKEKAFREQQSHDLERQREEQRVLEHNEQVRHMLMLQAEVQRQHEQEVATKVKEQTEWKKVLKDNAARLDEKQRQRELQRLEDRDFQRRYVENLERQERERAEVKARKEARAAMFQQMANTVALMHLKKVQNVEGKIEAEYEEQQRRAVEDEEQRRLRAKQRVKDTQKVLEMQKQLHDQQRALEKEEEKRLADAMIAQAREAEFQELSRKHAAKSEAARLKEFLSTQVQLQHFRETRPLQTSITRPESRAATMYSPSRYSPSPTVL